MYVWDNERQKEGIAKEESGADGAHYCSDRSIDHQQREHASLLNLSRSTYKRSQKSSSSIIFYFFLVFFTKNSCCLLLLDLELVGSFRAP
jgi:hypothetical protein